MTAWRSFHSLGAALLLALLPVFATNATGQELDPRAYTPVPVGGNLLITAFIAKAG